jgi:glycerol uptake facilitator protein
MLSQLAGAFAGSIIVWLFYFSHWGVTQNSTAKLATFNTSPAIRSLPINLLCETIATMIFVIGVLLIGANKFTDGLNPIVVGALIVSVGLSLGGTTGFAINPARDLGPRLAHFILPIPGKGTSDWSYSWIPVIGPFVGGLLGSWLYNVLFN